MEGSNAGQRAPAPPRCSPRNQAAALAHSPGCLEQHRRQLHVSLSRGTPTLNWCSPSPAHQPKKKNSLPLSRPHTRPGTGRPRQVGRHEGQHAPAALPTDLSFPPASVSQRGAQCVVEKPAEQSPLSSKQKGGTDHTIANTRVSDLKQPQMASNNFSLPGATPPFLSGEKAFDRFQ